MTASEENGIWTGGCLSIFPSKDKVFLTPSFRIHPPALMPEDLHGFLVSHKGKFSAPSQPTTTTSRRTSGQPAASSVVSSAPRLAPSDSEIGRLLAGLSPTRADDRTTWINLGFALHNISSTLLPEWIAFSRMSTKFTEGECDRKWASMRDRPDGFSIMSIRKWFQEDATTSSDSSPATEIDMSSSSSATENRLDTLSSHISSTLTLSSNISTLLPVETSRITPDNVTLLVTLFGEQHREHLGDWCRRPTFSPHKFFLYAPLCLACLVSPTHHDPATMMSCIKVEKKRMTMVCPLHGTRAIRGAELEQIRRALSIFFPSEDTPEPSPFERLRMQIEDVSGNNLFFSYMYYYPTDKYNHMQSRKSSSRSCRKTKKMEKSSARSRTARVPTSPT